MGKAPSAKERRAPRRTAAVRTSRRVKQLLLDEEQDDRRGASPAVTISGEIGNIANDEDEDDEAHSLPPPPNSVTVQRALDNITELATIAARNVWGRAMKLKVEDYPTIKVHVGRGSDVPQAARTAMLDIWAEHYLNQRREKPELPVVTIEDMKQAMFIDETAVIWFATVEVKSEIQVVCVLQPETERISPELDSDVEDVLWLLYLYAHPNYERFDFQAPMLHAVEHYSRVAGIRKIVAISATPYGPLKTKNCTNEWIRLLKRSGCAYRRSGTIYIPRVGCRFKKSEDSPDADSDERWKHLRRWERLVAT